MTNESGSTVRTPSGVLAEHLDSLDVLALCGPERPLVTVRAVSWSTAVWIEPSTCTIMLAPLHGRPAADGPRDGLARVFRNPSRLVVDGTWSVEILFADGWREVKVPMLTEITVVSF